MSNQDGRMVAWHRILKRDAQVKNGFVAILLAAAVGAPTIVIAAAPSCGSRTELLETLAKKYSEAPVAVGLANNGALIEVLTSGSGSTWTIIVSQPNGTSCLVAAGEEWQQLNQVASSGLGI